MNPDFKMERLGFENFLRNRAGNPGFSEGKFIIIVDDEDRENREILLLLQRMYS